MPEVDLVVIGTGPGGEALANKMASAGLEVVAVDRHLVGGECPYYACIPSKIMLRGADAVAETRRAGELAGEVTLVPSWAPVAARVKEATAGWDDSAAVERLEKAGATVLHGSGRLDGPGRVVVTLPDGSEVSYTTRRGVVLNPGTTAAAPPVEGLAGTPYWTNREAVQATAVPASLVVLGGGPVGCELAQAFARFGSQVTVVESGDRLLAKDEPEAAAVLEQVFVRDGVRVLTGTQITRAAYADGAFSLGLSDDSQLITERLLVGAGRTPNLDGLGLDSVGLDPERIEVDERLRAADGVWILGDVTGHGAFTHVSMYQSAIAGRDILGEDGPPAEYHAVPHTTFTDPEVAGVGMTEQAARDAGLAVRVAQTDLAESSRGYTHGPGAEGLVKVVEDADAGVLVGATVVGPAGGEVIAMLTLAVHARIPVATLRSMIYAYPTFHRAIATALDDLS